MRIASLSVRRAAIAFRFPFDHSAAARAMTDSVIVAVRTVEGPSGYGEATPRAYVTGESSAEVLGQVRRISGSLEGVAVSSPEDIDRRLGSLEPEDAASPGIGLNARCALELALLDALGRCQGRPVLEMLGGPRTETIRYDGVLPLGEPERLDPLLEKMRRLRMKQVKVKVGEDTKREIAVLGRVRAVLGPDVVLRIDANGAWDLPGALRRIRDFVAEGVRAVEEPLAKEARDEYPALVDAVGSDVAIFLDDSVCSIEDARRAVQRRWATGISLKVSKHGGLLPSLRIADLARDAGLVCSLGCHVGETSLLSAAGRILAAVAPGGFTAHEGCYGAHLLVHDIVAQPLGFGPHGDAAVADVGRTPGLGVDVDLDLLGRCRSDGRGGAGAASGR
jgi:L-alanine-DL-glutamate epimerase-like enolase superfamily enzyme